MIMLTQTPLCLSFILLKPVLGTAVIIFFRVVGGLVLLRFLFSLVVIPKENKLKQFVTDITEPILSPVRKMISKSAYGKTLRFDASPFITCILLGLLEFILLKLFSFMGL